MGHQFQVVPLALIDIRDQVVRAVVPIIGIHCVVDLPKIFEAGRIVHGLPRFRTAAFVRSVIHDRDTRENRPQLRIGIGLI